MVAVDNNIEISTRGGAIWVSTRIGSILQDHPENLKDNRVVRWYHTLLPRDQQRKGFGYMRKREALEAAMKIAMDRGELN